jgi:uncharacterized membrane protein
LVRKSNPKVDARLQPSWVERRMRFLVAGVAGAAASGAAWYAGGSGASIALTGWNALTLVYLAQTWMLLLHADEEEVRKRAAVEDESQFAILAIVIGAIAASLGAIVILLMRVRSGHGTEHALAPVLAVLTLVASWLMMQTVFVIHYAHRHFGDRDRNGTGDGGFLFPGEPARTYKDFIYLSLCIGATFQVSDPSVTRSSLRNLVATHSALAYFYNTAILALGINIVAGLIGR